MCLLGERQENNLIRVIEGNSETCEADNSQAYFPGVCAITH